MTIFMALVLTVLTFAFVIYPFYRRRYQPASATGDDKTRELYSQRDTSYSMLKELEFDHESGILSDEDYQDLQTRYRKKAISILKNLDGVEKKGSVGDEIEKQVRAMRRKKPAPADVKDKTEDKIEKEVREMRQGKPKFCSQCGVKVREGDRFCSSCGTSLT